MTALNPQTQAVPAKPARSVWRYLAGCRLQALATAPLLYAGIFTLFLLDLFLTLVVQAVCFRAWGVPRVRRAECFQFDRSRLPYLNAVEKLNCAYCSYANGLFAYAREIGARTEQHWCPIKHAYAPGAPHSHYGRFLPYDDAASYVRQVEALRKDFRDH